MIPKVGKNERKPPRSWRPIALLSCLGKGLQCTVTCMITWTAMTHKILSPQHGGVLPRRSGADPTAAWARGKHISLVTMDVQGDFDALIRTGRYSAWLSKADLRKPSTLLKPSRLSVT